MTSWDGNLTFSKYYIFFILQLKCSYSYAILVLTDSGKEGANKIEKENNKKQKTINRSKEPKELTVI